MLRGRIEDAAQVVDARRAVDVEPKLRQLQRHVAFDPRCTIVVEDAEVVARRQVGLGRGSRALAEVVERQEQAALGQALHGGDRFLDRLAGDEAAREPARRHPVAGRESLQQLNLREGVKKGLRRGVEHQPAFSFQRSAVGDSRCEPSAES